MNCAEVMENLELSALGALSEDEAAGVKTHVESCAACRQEADRLRGQIEQFRKSLRTDAAEDPSVQPLRQRLQREIWRSRAQARLWAGTRTLRRVAAVIALVAGLLYAGFRIEKGGGKCACESWTQSGIASFVAGDAAYPLVAAQRLYALMEEPDGPHVVALDRRSGSRFWKTSFPVAGSPGSDSRGVYVWNVGASGELQLTALDPKTGKTVWIWNDHSLSPAVPSAMVVSGERLCWSTATGVVAVDSRTGRTAWTRTLSSEALLSVPAADAKRAYVAAGESLYALDLADGKVCWQQFRGGTALSLMPPLVQCDGPTVVMAAGTGDHGVLRSYRADTGELLWQKEATERPRHLLVAEGRVYLRGSQIQAFDGRTGALAWSIPMGGCSPVTVVNDRVYVVEGQDRKGIFAFRADTGQQVWSRQTMSSCSGFVVSGKMGYLNTQDGVLCAVRIFEHSG